MSVQKARESNKRSYHGSGAESNDQFPVGMRVLAVDDNRVCLMVLKMLLLHCQYHVTTTNQAESALKLLRENKDDFDIVISNVHMPDMDGFKLLEIVGLEMDLPVILLSGNDATKSVMKGITCGACDYLVKPVRITELKNIWQHVIRRKSSNKSHVKSTQANTETREGGDTGGIPLDRSLRLNCGKNKDQNVEHEYDSEETRQENEDASTQKKQRVIWAGDLQRKFVEAVNYLGIDKAVPKKILELMGAENLTRENVASHLQKYRQLLKKISNATKQEANVMAAFGGYGQLPTLASIQQGGRFGSFNSPSSYGFPDLHSHAHKNQRLPTKGFGTFPCINPSGIQRAGFSQGMMPNPAFGTSQVTRCQPMLESYTTLATSFSDVTRALSNASYSLFGATNSFQSSKQQQKQQKESNGIAINSSGGLTPLCSDSLGANPRTCPPLSDLGEYYTEAWGRFDSMLNSFHCHGNLPPSSGTGCNQTSSDPTTGGDLLQTQANSFSGRSLNAPTDTHEGQLADVGSASSSYQGRDQTLKPISSFNPGSVLRDGCRSESDSSSIDRLNFNSTLLRQNSDEERSAAYNQMKFLGDYIMEPTELSGYDSNAHDSFENLLNSLVRQGEQSISLDGGGDIGINSLFN